MYLMISKYLAPLDEVDAARGDHLAFIDGLEQRGLLVTAGRQNPPVGGIVVLAVDDEAQAVEIMADDPYLIRGLAEYSAVGWTPSRGVLADYGKA